MTDNEQRLVDEPRQTYFITAKEFPVAIGMEDVTYAEALMVATNCMFEGQLLNGPDTGPEGFVVSFDHVAGVRVTPKQPSGPAMQMPAELVRDLLAEREGSKWVPDSASANGS
ncbi:hypothetical protein ACFWMR_02085 [Amycolatopsis thailandensis]|uniref:hypothetical protein n=1 Tax=Amycolatopsis thailandensis TaxID=589330 RepID=UPI0036474413